MSSESLFRIGEWQIDPQRCVAQRSDETVRLEPRAVELLAYLASRPGEVVSRAELLEAVWPGVVVSDEAITNAVAKLRRALSDSSKSAKLIETIPKRGYRVVDVAVVRQATPGDRPTGHSLDKAKVGGLVAVLVVVAMIFAGWRLSGDNPTPTAEVRLSAQRPSITVLPFTNLSGDDEQDWFVDGLTEDLITDLSGVSGLFVIARNSSFIYKGSNADVAAIGRELGVRYLIEGSVRRVADRLRINVKLIDTASGGHLWATRYDGSLDELFTFQDDITARVVDALAVKMTSLEKDYAAFQETYTPRAYEEFLQGWAFYRGQTPEDFRRAIAHLERALEEDAGYGRAAAALAAVYWETYQRRWYRRLGLSPDSLVWQRANEYLDRSMIAPTPLAHKVASAMLIANRRFAEARAEAERAVAIDPNDPLGHLALAEVLVATGEASRAEEVVREAMRRDPHAPNTYLFTLGKAQLIKGDIAQSIDTLERATRTNPDNRLAWMALVSAYGLSGKSTEAEAALRTLDDLQHRDQLVAFTVANAREHWPFENAGDNSAFLDGLRKAGVPEW